MEAIITRLADVAAAAHDLESLTRPMLELLETVTGMESSYLTSVDGTGLQNVLYARNTKQMQIPEGLSVPWDDTLCRRALEEGRHYTDDVGGCWGDSDAARQLGITTYLSEPVRRLDGQLYGTLCAASAARISIRPETLKVFAIFARLIAHQVERESLVDDLRRSNRQLSTHALLDPLTGIANRRALEQELDRRLNQADRGGGRILVAFIDLDGFKAINDHHGHDMGDRFLTQVARRLAEGLRGSDLVARCGGDEFVVLAPTGAPGDFGERLAALLRGRYVLGDVAIDYRGASIGVVASDPGDGVEALLQRADAAMYQQKKIRRCGRL